jgi:hypothetical protein
MKRQMRIAGEVIELRDLVVETKKPARRKSSTNVADAPASDQVSPQS